MIYVLYGADSYSRREAFDELKRTLDEDGSLETNTVWLRAREASPQEVVAACTAAPFLGGLRLVVLEGLLRVTQEGAGRGKRSAADATVTAWEPLLQFFDEMPESTALVLMDGGATDKNPVLTALSGKAEIREFKPPANLVEWVQTKARAMSLKLEGRAARLLVQMVGGQEAIAGGEYLDTWCLAAELEKLAAYANGGTVGEAEVRALSPVLREQKGYFLCDAIAEGKPATAAKLLHELLEQQEPGQVVLSTIAGRFRRLATAREMLDRGETEAAIGSELAAKGYGLEKLIEQAAWYSIDHLRRIYGRIADADFNNKSGLSDEAAELHILVQELSAVRGAGIVNR